jgi:hypothetical protein
MRGETAMLNTDVRKASSTDQSEQEHIIPLAALMVHVDAPVPRTLFAAAFWQLSLISGAYSLNNAAARCGERI